MEVKPGYKQTEVGIIPEDWEIKRLEEIADVIMGQSPAGSTYNKSGIGLPLINGPTEFTKINPVKVQWTSLPTKICKKNDLLICVRGSSTGRTNISDDEYCIGRGIAAIRANMKSNTEYLTYQINLGIERLLALSAGSTFPNVDGKSIRSIHIPLPPTKAEQEAIAEALSDADALLEALEQLLAKKRYIKQGAMQELLRPKEGWVTKLLGDIAEVRDGTHQTPKYVQNGIPFFSVENVTSGNFTNTKFISEAEHQFLTRSFKIEKGDILMTRIGSIGDCKLVDWDVEASFYVSLALLKIRKGYSAAFICQYSESSFFKKEVELNSLQSAIPKKINLGPISDVKVQIPSELTEQIAIAAVVSDMDSEIAALEAQLAKARQVKQGMMQELLSGKTRLVGAGERAGGEPGKSRGLKIPVNKVQASCGRGNR